jgi:hypothetical protein
VSIRVRPVALMREYWRDPDGVWRDDLLMELSPAS